MAKLMCTKKQGIHDILKLKSILKSVALSRNNLNKLRATFEEASVTLVIGILTSDLFTLGLCTDVVGAVSHGGFMFWSNVTHHGSGVTFSCVVWVVLCELLSKSSSHFNSSICSNDCMFFFPFNACARSEIALEITSAGDRVGWVKYFILKNTVLEILSLFICLTWIT